jgi:hypothetical protein
MHKKPFPGDEQSGLALDVGNYEASRVAPAQLTNLAVNCLPLGMTENDVRRMFTEFGQITRAMVKMPQEALTPGS